LYDVFVNVRNDEAEHMKTMEFCQLPGNELRSPSSREAMVLLSEEACLVDVEDCEEDLKDEIGERSCEGLVDCVVNFGTGVVNTYEPQK
jgi:ubiquinol oxidase